MEVMIPAIRSESKLVGKQEQKRQIWTEIVAEKIRKQKELLEIIGKEESGLLAGYLEELELE